MAGSSSSPTSDQLNFVSVPGVTVSALGKSGKIKVTLNNQEIALVSHQGQLHAFQAKCPHKGGPLEQGQIEDLAKARATCIRCPWHAYEFNIATGDCIAPGPSADLKLKVYPVKVNKDEIKIGFRKTS